MTPDTFQFPQVAVARTCFRTKFGIPRQPGLIPEATGFLELLPPFNQPNTVRGLEAFSHIWVIFVFNANFRDKWKATVRPPRLGGDRRLGVFATRSPFRPAPLGLSVLRLDHIELGDHGRIRIHVSGLDLLDGTPVLDIKPYIPYTDAIPGADGGFAPDAPDDAPLHVTVSPKAQALLDRRPPAFAALCRKVVAADPRPAYQREPGRVYQCYLDDCEVLWQIGDDPATAVITDLRPAPRNISPVHRSQPDDAP